jgi:GxxExxY protein
MLIDEELSEKVLGAAIEVHRELGAGLYESIYRECICHELSLRGIAFRREVPIPISYKGIKLDCGYRADLIVEERLLLELKAVEKLIPVHKAQLMTYMKVTGMKVGLLLNFNVPLLKDGIIRIVL